MVQEHRLQLDAGQRDAAGCARVEAARSSPGLAGLADVATALDVAQVDLGVVRLVVRVAVADLHSRAKRSEQLTRWWPSGTPPLKPAHRPGVSSCSPPSVTSVSSPSST